MLLVFRNLTMMSHHVDLGWEVFCMNLLSFLNLLSFAKSREFSGIDYFAHFFNPVFFLSFQVFDGRNGRSYTIISQVPQSFSLFFCSVFSLCCSDWVIAIFWFFPLPPSFLLLIYPLNLYFSVNFHLLIFYIF